MAEPFSRSNQGKHRRRLGMGGVLCVTTDQSYMARAQRRDVQRYVCISTGKKENVQQLSRGPDYF